MRQEDISVLIERRDCGVSERPETETWEEVIDRVLSGKIAEVSYGYWQLYLDCCPLLAVDQELPLLLASNRLRGRWILAGNCNEPVILFWVDGKRYFVRRLSRVELDSLLHSDDNLQAVYRGGGGILTIKRSRLASV